MQTPWFVTGCIVYGFKWIVRNDVEYFKSVSVLRLVSSISIIKLEQEILFPDQLIDQGYSRIFIKQLEKCYNRASQQEPYSIEVRHKTLVLIFLIILSKDKIYIQSQV